MELVTPFILGIISAIVCFLIYRFSGLNIRGIVASVPIVFILLPLVILTFQASSNPENTIQNLNVYLTNFVEYLPALLMGQLGGMLGGFFFRPPNN